MIEIAARLPIRQTILSITLIFVIAQAATAQSTLAGGGAFTLVVKSDGTVWSFGLNNNGQLGINSLVINKTPIQIPGLSGVATVAAGGVHSMALTSTGALYTWGDNLYGQLGVTGADRKTPLLLSLSNVTAIAAGEFHSLALTSAGDVYAWGRDNLGQIGNGDTTSTNVTSPTLVLTGVVAIGAGRNHSLAVKSDGTAWAWGANGSGQLGNDTISTGATSSPIQMHGITNASQIVGGEAHSLIMLDDGTVYGAGENGAGQLGDTTSTDRDVAVPVGTLSNVAQIVSGLDHAFARLGDGSIWGWGENTGGQLGLDANTVDQHSPVEVSGLSGIAAIAAGWNHSISVDTTGVVRTWGANASTQLGEGTTNPRSVPIPISGAAYAWRVATAVLNPDSGTFYADKPVIVTVATDSPLTTTIRYTQNGVDPTENDAVVASGGSITATHSQTIKAKAWTTGMPAGEVGVAAITMQVAQPTASPGQATYTTPPGNVTFSTTTAGATIRYTNDGTDPATSPTAVSGPSPVTVNVQHTTTFRIVGVKSGWTTSTVRQVIYTMNFGTLAAPVIDPPSGEYTGAVTMIVSTAAPGVVHYTTALGITTPATPLASSPTQTPFPIKQTTKVRARSFHPDYAPSVGEVTRTYTIKASTPQLDVPEGSYAPGSAVTVTAGDATLDTLRMTIDGSDPTNTSPLIASGTSILLGNFTLKVRAFRVSNYDIDSDVASAAYTLNAPLGPGSVTGGGNHTVIATPDGRVFAWGDNQYGQLGNGTSVTDRLTPQLLNSITGVTVVAGGLSHTLARTWDGQVYSWGLNINGRLGNNSTTLSNKPIHVSTLSNVVAVAAGDTHSLALTSDGRVFGWGGNASRQLGLGHNTDQWLPVEIPGLSNIVAIAAGDSTSFAVSNTGQLYGWGSNGSSRLSLPSEVTVQATPLILDLADVVAIAPGFSHTVAMTKSGEVYAWGASASGQAGVIAPSVQQPTKIQGLHAVAITSGDSHSGAIRSDGALVAWGENSDGQIGNNSTQDVNVPVVVAGLSGVAAFAFGDTHSVAVTTAGQVLTWGNAADGRLGNTTTTPDVPTPQSVYSIPSIWPTAAPVITPVSGPYETAQTVAMATADTSAVIHYTLDDTTPTEVSSVYSEPFEVTTTTTVKARAFVTGAAPSAVTTSVITFVFGSLSAPAASPTGGLRPSIQVALTAEEGATIRYTLDGLTPTTSSTAYSTPIPLTTSGVVTLKAKAFKAGWVDSPTMIEIYTIDSIPPTNIASLFPSPINGWNNTPVTITFHCTDNFGLADCPAPLTVSAEGAAQVVSQSATDLAGNQTAAGSSISVDLTGPVVTLTSPSTGLVTTDGVATLTALASDAVSGVVSVTCNGVAATLTNGQVSCEVPLRNGVNSLVVTAQDAAGNSGSAGVRVMRVGTPTSLALAPSTGTKLVGDAFSMSLRDEFGALAEAASWETSNPDVISVSTDDPPLLTAVGAGTATITATKDTLSATATVAVVADGSLLDGTVTWSVENLGADPITVNTVDAEAPATFTSTFDAGSWTVNALSADGRQLWKEAAPGQPVMADHVGGLVAFTGSSTGLARFAGPEEALPWRHKVAGTLLTLPSQAPDGTIYVIDHQPGTSPRGSATTDAVVLAIDGNSGALKYRYPLPRSRFVYDSIFSDALANGCTQPPEEYGASYTAPVIGSDGRAYVTVTPHDVHVNRRWINNACVDALVNYKNHIKMIALSSSGAVTTLEVLNETNNECSDLAYPKEVLSDGGSRIVIMTHTNSQCSGYGTDDVAYKTLLVDATGAVTSYASTPGFSITMTSDTTAYWTTTVGNVVATDLSTGTVKWTAPVPGTALLPHADDGLTLRSNDGLVFLDGNGVVTNTAPLTLDLASVRQGSLLGTNAAGAVASVSNTTVPFRVRSYFKWFNGNDFNQRRPEEPEVVITFNVFIPEEWVTSPFLSSGDNVQIFQGDNRSFQRDGSSRIHQVVRISLNGVNNNVAIGQTIQYEKLSSLDANAHLTVAAKSDTVLGDDYLKHAVGRASPNEVRAEHQRNGNIVTARIRGAASDPLVPAPAVDYDITVTVDFSDPTNPQYTIQGAHDGFPNYEIWVNDSRKYEFDYRSHGQTPFSMVPPMEWTIAAISGSIRQ